MGVLPDQHPELARVVGVLERQKRVLEIAAADTIAATDTIREEVGIGQVDFVDESWAQLAAKAGKIELGTLSEAPEMSGAAGVDEQLGKAPRRQAKVVRLIDEASVGLERPALLDRRGRLRLGKLSHRRSRSQRRLRGLRRDGASREADEQDARG